MTVHGKEIVESLSGFPNRSSSVGCRASKEDEILIWIRDYEGSGTPWLLLKCLMEGDSCSLITQKRCLISLAVSTVMEAESRCSRLRTSATNTGSKTSLKASRALSRMTCP